MSGDKIVAQLREFPDYTTVNIGKHRATFNKWVLEAADALDAKDKLIAELEAALEQIEMYAPDVGVDQFHEALRAARALLSSSLLNKEDRNG